MSWYKNWGLTKTRWSETCFFLLLLVLPWQTRKIFFSSQPFNEWLSGSLFITDLLLLFLLVPYLVSRFCHRTKLHWEQVGLLVFLLWSVASISWSASPLLA